MKKAFQVVVGLFFLPTVILLTAELTTYFFINDWVTVIATLAVTIAALILFGSKLEDLSASKSVVKLMLIVLTGAGVIVSVLSRKNLQANYFGTVHYAVAIGCAFIFFVYMLTVDLFRSRYNRSFVECIEFSWLTTSATVYAAIWLLSEMYVHFGTQFVWMPTIALTAMLSLCFIDKDLRLKNGFLIIIALPATIALASTLYQFWFSMTIFECPLWWVFVSIVLTVVIIMLIIIIVGYWNDRKQAKLEKIRKEKEARERFEEEKTAQSKIAEIFKKTLPSWDEIIYVSKNSRNRASDLLELGVKITQKSLTELVEISAKKKQLFYNDRLPNALSVLEEMTKATQNDEVLQAIEEQYKELFELIERHPKFAGASLLAQTIYRYETMKNVFWPLHAN